MIYLPVFGYLKWDKSNGQCPIAENENFQIQKFGGRSIYLECLRSNQWSICPGANIITGMYNIYLAASTNKPDKSEASIYFIEEEFITKYRVLTLIKGIAELTLVGGWILHGGATLYYYATRPTPEEAPPLIH